MLRRIGHLQAVPNQPDGVRLCEPDVNKHDIGMSFPDLEVRILAGCRLLDILATHFCQSVLQRTAGICIFVSYENLQIVFHFYSRSVKFFPCP